MQKCHSDTVVPGNQPPQRPFFHELDRCSLRQAKRWPTASIKAHLRHDKNKPEACFDVTVEAGFGFLFSSPSFTVHNSPPPISMCVKPICLYVFTHLNHHTWTQLTAVHLLYICCTATLKAEHVRFLCEYFLLWLILAWIVNSGKKLIQLKWHSSEGLWGRWSGSFYAPLY